MPAGTGILLFDDAGGVRSLMRSQQGRLNPARLPGTLDNASLRFVVQEEATTSIREIAFINR